MKKLHKNVYLMGFLSLFNDLSSDMLTPLLPAWLNHLGYGVVFLGFLEGFANISSNLAKLASGFLSERFGTLKKWTFWGYFTSALARSFVALPLVPVIFLARFVDRLGKGFRTVPRDTLLTHCVDKSLWGRAFGVQRSMDHFGAMMASLLSTLILIFINPPFSLYFVAIALPGLVSCLVFAPKLEEKKRALEPRLEKATLISWRKLDPPFRRYLIIIGLAALTTPSDLFMIQRIQELGLPLKFVPLVWLLMNFCTLVAAYWGGWLSDHWGRRKTIATGWILFSLVFIALSQTRSLFLTISLIGFFGFQSGLVEASERSYTASLALDHQRSSYLGWYYFAYGLGILPASLFFGWLWSFGGAGLAFISYALGGLIPIFLLLTIPSSQKPNSL
ncbi:MAG: major facilitator superfamily MFS_1 [uncultured bacterium]|nr:MAG: major facilitator superfamily MFS_1 [uncultured bacterium]